MEVTVKQLSQLTKFEHNVRVHSERQIKEYARSIEMFGQIRPIVVDEHGVILAGNGLYDALNYLGKTTCDCYVVEGLSDAQKKKLMLSDNKIYELGFVDESQFDEIINTLALDEDYDIPGYDEDLLKTLTASLDEATDKVAEYGKINEASIAEIKSREEYRENNPAPQAPDHYVVAPDFAPSIGNKKETSEEVGASAETHRYVVCPHCGEKICL